MSMNRLWNTKNTNQGPAKRVLCLCSAGLLRSPTVAWVLSNDPWNYNTRAAGTSQDHALVAVDQYLLEWADEVVCVEPYIRDELTAYVAKHEIDIGGKSLVTLDIPDRYIRRAPKLVELITKQYQDHQHAENAKDGT